MTISTAAVFPSRPAFTAAAFRRGLVAGLPFLASYGAPALVMGVAYKGLGLGFVPAVLFSLLVYSSTAQAVTLGLWALPPPIAAFVLASVATNARYLVMGAHLHQSFGRFGKCLMYPILFFLSDGSWMLTAADTERSGPDAGYLLGSSLPGWIGWVAGTGLGYLLPLKATGPFAAATAVLPLAFVITLLPTQWRGGRFIVPWLASAAGGLIAAAWLGESWAMLAGGSIGTFYSLIRGDDA
ncbi:AzlC family ABC transporter permease [Lichenifustis flavocetrariae]|uniref:AzlC family ABC transporter permease n=1 Tax=Lichenifustis flavocetrariae TaxID=2949735 RepID=A0AA41Z2A2_9HYPH|nr:AzlC family ABC transporter permease [Lichenifustis flavocetrariae]MCW6512906.1 AzlC family ABC transporter permease [Lichenifustis flavocetrariae]